MYKPVKVNIEFIKCLSKTQIMPKQDMSCSTAIYCTICFSLYKIAFG